MELILHSGIIVEFDDSDYELVSKYKWFSIPRGGLFYIAAKPIIDGRVTTIYMHRLIMDAKKGEEVDHIDSRGENNHRINLRLCSRQDNMCCRRKRKNTGSKYLGVSKYNDGIRWVAQIQRDKKVYFLGIYLTEEQAALAYNRAAVEKHGEFARLNVIDDIPSKISSIKIIKKKKIKYMYIKVLNKMHKLKTYIQLIDNNK